MVDFTTPLSNLDSFLKLNGKDKYVLLNQLAHRTKQTHQEHYKQLLIHLSNHAAKSDTHLQNALREDTSLANLIITQLLETESNDKKQKKLLLDVFKNHKNHDWNDPAFNQLIQSKLLALLTKLQPQEIKELFRHYVNISPQLIDSAPNRIKFLDHIYAVTTSSQIINHCIEALDDTALLVLIAGFFTIRNQDNDFKNTIKPILLVFCQRLYTAQNPEAPVHQWVKALYAEQLVHTLLENPDCVQQLTQSYSTFYNFLAWSNTTQALKYRMDAVLNFIELKEEKINHITVCWLEHFQNQPDQLYALFNTLNATGSNRNDRGKKNLSGLKQALWKLIKPDTPYKEEEFSSCIFNLKPTTIKQILSTLTQKKPAISDTNTPTKENILRWIRSFDIKTKQETNHDHPLIQFIIDAKHLLLDPELTQNNLFQEFIKVLLVAPPLRIKSEQFEFLLSLLTIQNQILLALNILALPRLTPIHIHSIAKLTNILSPIELFKIHERHYNPSFIAERLLVNPQGLDNLSDAQQKKLWDSIDNSERLLGIINNQSSLDGRLKIIKSIYRIYGQDIKTFSNQLVKWHVTPEALATIANYTTDQSHQDILHNVLDATPNYREFVSEYLHRPTLNMPLFATSYLYVSARSSLSQNNLKKPCSPQFLQDLTITEVFVIMKNNFDWARSIQALEPFLSPFKSNGSVAQTLLRSARWQQRLGLIHSGLLEILHFYQKKQTALATKEIIKQTDIYKNFLLPLLHHTTTKVLDEILPTQLFAALCQYIKVIESLDPEHYKRIDNTLTRYKVAIELMKDFTIPQLYHYFSADSAPELSSPWDTSHNGTHQWLNHDAVEPEMRFTELLNAYLIPATSNQQNEIEQWFFQCALLSTFPKPLETSALKTFLTSIRPSQLSVLIYSFFKQLQYYRQAQKLLQNLKPSKSVHEFIQQLVHQDTTTLEHVRNISDSLNLTSLNDLILFAEALKNNGLNEGQASVLILSPELSADQDVKWLNIDLQLLDGRINLIATKLNQLTYLGFSYNQDAYNNERLLKLTQNNLNHLPADVALGCLNSYGAMFTESTADSYQYLKTLNQLLNKFNEKKELVASIEKTLLQQIIIAGVRDPIEHWALLEQLILSNNAPFCLQQIQLELNRLLQPLQNTPSTGISELSAEQIEYLPPADLSKMLSLQKLLFLGKPIPQLLSFTTLSEAPETVDERRLFCADVSMYQVIVHLQKSSKHIMSKTLGWLKEQHQRHVKNYAATIERLNSEREIKYPTVHYYWLCWSSFIMDKTSHDKTLIEGFIHWLRTSGEQQLKDAPDLNNLLEHIRDNNLLKEVLLAAIKIRKNLLPEQINWLSERCIILAPKEATILSHVISLCSRSWLEDYMQRNPPTTFDLLRAALGNDVFINEVNTSKDSQLRFLNHLTHYKLSYSQLLKCITQTQNESVRSLLIIHLLSQPEYLNGLKGDSILKRLAHPETHTPSRIQPLIRQLNVKQLDKAIIKKLAPETAISILCSMPHFHQLDSEQLRALLEKTPKSTFIFYWISHYALMPHAPFILAQFMKLADLDTQNGLSRLANDKKELIITNMLKHLELFQPIPQILYENNQEEYLILALRLFLNGHTHQVYIDYIHQLMLILLRNETHQFSLPVIQLLMCLNDKKEFTSLTNKMSYLTNNYLRTKAHGGEIGIFYRSSRLNIKSMTQAVQLKPKQSTTETVTGFFTSIFGETIDEASNKQIGTVTPEHPLIAELNPEKPISFFKYFLIHYRGESSHINKTMNDFLSFYSQNKTETLGRSIHEIGHLIHRPVLDKQTREALFDSFLHYPDLYDVEISYDLLMFDAKRAIQHFGLKGGAHNYNRVINLCNLALEKLDDATEEEQAVINIATKALKEAELELTANQEQGFFAQLWMRIKRCWILGWTGFFYPNLPLYVTTQHSKVTQDAIPLGFKFPYKPEPNLACILDDNTPWTSEKLKELSEAITLFSLKAMPENELHIREKLHDLVSKLRKTSTIQPWLLENEQSLSNNFVRLVELMMINGAGSKIALLIQQENDYLTPLQGLIIQELHYKADEQEIINDNKPVAPITAPGFVANVSSSFLHGLGTFFSSNSKSANGNTPPMSQTPAP